MSTSLDMIKISFSKTQIELSYHLIEQDQKRVEFMVLLRNSIKMILKLKKEYYNGFRGIQETWTLLSLLTFQNTECPPLFLSSNYTTIQLIVITLTFYPNCSLPTVILLFSDYSSIQHHPVTQHN